MRKKKSAVLDDFLPTLIFLLLMAITIFLFIGYNKAINQKTTLNSIAREYILKMETTGYMTPEFKQDLYKDLKDAGFVGTSSGGSFSDGNFTGTTVSDVGYGNEIQLTIKVYTKNRLLKASDNDGKVDIMKPNFKDDYSPIMVTYKSTSKE